MKTILSILISALLLVSCQQPEEPKEPEIIMDEDLRALINQKNNTLEQLYADGDIDSAATYFADNVIQLPPNAPAMKGIEAYTEDWKKSISMGKWLFNFEAQEVKRSGPMAVELGTYTLKFEPNENAPMPGFDDHGHYVVLWEKQNDEWKIVWDAPVSEVPLPMSIPQEE